MARAFKLSGVTFTQTGLPNIFDPSFLSSLIGWWDASQGLTVNGSNQVTAWTDQSGAGNTLGNATPANSLVETAAAQNGLAAISSPGITQEYSVQSTAAIASLGFQSTNPFTVFTIIKRLATSPQKTFEALVHNNASAAFAGWELLVGSTYGSTVTFRITGASGSALVHGSTALVNGQAYAITVTVDGTGTAAGIQIYINGVAETMTVVSGFTAIAGAVANGPLVIGGGNLVNFYDTDYICEVAILNAKATTSQLASLAAYALAKWAA